MADRLVALAPGSTVTADLVAYRALIAEANNPTIVVSDTQVIDTIKTPSGASLIGQSAWRSLADLLVPWQGSASSCVYRPGEPKAQNPFPYIETRYSLGVPHSGSPILEDHFVQVVCWDKPEGGAEKVGRMAKLVLALLHNNLVPECGLPILGVVRNQDFGDQQAPNYGWYHAISFRFCLSINEGS